MNKFTEAATEVANSNDKTKYVYFVAGTANDNGDTTTVEGDAGIIGRGQYIVQAIYASMEDNDAAANIMMGAVSKYLSKDPERADMFLAIAKDAFINK